MASRSITETGRHLGHRLDCRAQCLAERRQGRPLGLPAAQRPLVLLDHARHDRGREMRGAVGGGQSSAAPHRIALVRHGRGSAAARHRTAPTLRRTSTCIISEMSRAALPSAPHTSAMSCASAATRTLCVNHGPGGSFRPRRSASAVITGSASWPSADSEPEAPPNCTICVSPKLSSRRRVARSMSEAQPAIFWPSASGVAG